MKDLIKKSKKEKRNLILKVVSFIVAVLFIAFAREWSVGNKKLEIVFLGVGFLFAVISSIAMLRHDNLKSKRHKKESIEKFLKIKGECNKNITRSLESREAIFLQGAEAAIKSGCPLEFIEEQLSSYQN